jgi:hypothetical protein
MRFCSSTVGGAFATDLPRRAGMKGMGEGCRILEQAAADHVRFEILPALERAASAGVGAAPSWR